MDNLLTPYPLDSVKAVTFFLHPDASPLEVMQGEATDEVEITQFVSSSKQSPQEVSCGLAWHDELYGDNQPVPGQVLEVRLEGTVFWIGIIQTINDYTISSGTKRMTIVARSRDAMPAWRDAQRLSDVFPVGTELDYIVRTLLYGLGLRDAEINVPNLGMNIVHSNAQLADLTVWAMLTLLMQPAGFEPYVDARGRVKAISRDTQRGADIVLDDNTRLISVTGSRSDPSVTEVRIKWLDPNLTQVDQMDKSLASATVTAGFFQLEQNKDVYFSSDQTQRARDTRLVIKQSANSGLLPVCSEEYAQTSMTGGRITLQTYAWVPALTTALIAAKIAAHNTPDGVSTGYTIPIGRKYEGYYDVAIMLTLMCIGTGNYEIWGTPYDSVHARNTTTAYNSNASPWETNVSDIENDFVMNEDGAQAFAIRELIYASRSTVSWGINIVDDPRIEKGDIVQIASGERIYVTDYSRDLSPGSPAVLDITGFRC